MSFLRTYFPTAVKKGTETPKIDINTLNYFPRQYVMLLEIKFILSKKSAIYRLIF